MSPKDYYQILGIPKNASAEDIKAAYKKLAKEHHPDVAKDKAQAEVKFKEINEAYQVLSDPQKKKQYDTFGTTGAQNPFGGGAGQSGQWGPFSYSYSSTGESPFGDVDPFDIFEDVFGFRGFSGQRRPRKGKDLRFEMVVEFKDSVRGLEEEVSFGGKKLKVKVPAGIRDGNEIRFEGQGELGPNNLPNGDLYLRIRVKPHQILQRNGDDIYMLKEINFVEATLGAEIEIPVVELNSHTGESTTKLKIPSGTQPATTFRIRGKGMPKLRVNGRGDMFVQVNIKIPTKLSKDQKRILEEYKNLR